MKFELEHSAFSSKQAAAYADGVNSQVPFHPLTVVT